MTSQFQCVLSADLARRVQAAVSTEETRYYLNGFHVEPCAEGGALLVATDGHKMLIFRDPDGHVTSSAIVSLNTAMVKALKPGKRDAERLLVVSGQRAVIVPVTDVSRTSLVSSADNPDASCVAFQAAGTLVDGSFPDWRRVVPQGDTQPVCATFDATYVEALAEALKPDGQRKAFVRLVAKGRDIDDAAKSPHLMFAQAPIQGFAVIMPVRDPGNDVDDAPSWITRAD